MLIEVMVGALVLSIATAAVLDGLDGAQATGRKNKDRSVAATLAQQDTERLRALPIGSLVGLSQSRLVDVNGVNYTVTSKTSWMRDNSGELSCIDDTSQAAFLKVVSTAWSPASSDRPVTETTLITPPAAYSATSGTATVRVTDRDAKPLSGVQISLSGAASYTATTNALGCAIFSFIPTGDYKATAPGNLVSWNSEKPANVPFTVVPGKTTPVQMELAQPASIRLKFASSTGTALTWTSATIPHANLPAGGKVVTSGTAVSSFDVLNLFPQKDGYGVYAGNCVANNPANPYWGDPDYFLDNPGSFAKVNPGSSLVPVTAIMPTLKVTVTKAKADTSYVHIDQTDEPEEDIDCRVTRRSRSSYQASGTSTPLTTSYNYPFGHYTVCADNGSKYKSVPGDLLTNAGATATIDLTTAGTTAGTCPDLAP